VRFFFSCLYAAGVPGPAGWCPGWPSGGDVVPPLPTRFSTQEERIVFRLLFTPLSVDDFVAVKAHNFNRDLQNSTSSSQQIQQQPLGINKIQQISISSGNLVRDQGVGGSNPLSPTNLFKHLNCASGFPSTAL
jgi:hypothetical protein